MTPVADYKCLCGEGPLYDPRRDCVFWTDIDAGRLFRIDRATLQHRQIYASDPVGGFTLQDDGSLILFRVKDIARFDPESGQVTKLRDFLDDGIPRFNDTSAGPPPARMIYAGTMGKTAESGGLFELSPDGTLRNLFRGTGCANGMGWTPDLRTMYWTCSSRNQIFAYDFDPATGAMRNERIFHHARDRNTEGTCDGLTVDSLGNIYSARWGGHAIHMFRPDGSLLRKIAVPAANVTSLCFAGPDLKDVFITTASRGDNTKGAGALYHFRNETPGQPEFRSALAV